MTEGGYATEEGFETEGGYEIEGDLTSPHLCMCLC